MEMVSFLLVPSLVCACQSIFRHAYPPALSLCVRVLPSVISLSVSVNVSIHAFFRSRVLLYFWIVGVVFASTAQGSRQHAASVYDSRWEVTLFPEQPGHLACSGELSGSA